MAIDFDVMSLRDLFSTIYIKQTDGDYHSEETNIISRAERRNSLSLTNESHQISFKQEYNKPASIGAVAVKHVRKKDDYFAIPMQELNINNGKKLILSLACFRRHPNRKNAFIMK